MANKKTKAKKAATMAIRVAPIFSGLGMAAVVLGKPAGQSKSVIDSAKDGEYNFALDKVFLNIKQNAPMLALLGVGVPLGAKMVKKLGRNNAPGLRIPGVVNVTL